MARMPAHACGGRRGVPPAAGRGPVQHLFMVSGRDTRTLIAIRVDRDVRSESGEKAVPVVAALCLTDFIDRSMRRWGQGRG
eukprot:2206612-Prymnesium_polylepis.2